jgi:hypothetical protein
MCSPSPPRMKQEKWRMHTFNPLSCRGSSFAFAAAAQQSISRDDCPSSQEHTLLSEEDSFILNSYSRDTLRMKVHSSQHRARGNLISYVSRVYCRTIASRFKIMQLVNTTETERWKKVKKLISSYTIDIFPILARSKQQSIR